MYFQSASYEFLFFYLKSSVSYFSLFICFCSPSIHLKFVSSSNCSILLDVYNVCIACSLWSYVSCFYFSIWDKSFTSFRLVLNLVPILKRFSPKTNLSFWNLHVHYLFRRYMCVDQILLGPLQELLFCRWWFHRANCLSYSFFSLQVQVPSVYTSESSHCISSLSLLILVMRLNFRSSYLYLPSALIKCVCANKNSTQDFLLAWQTLCLPKHIPNTLSNFSCYFSMSTTAQAMYIWKHNQERKKCRRGPNTHIWTFVHKDSVNYSPFLEETSGNARREAVSMVTHAL